ncbi:MAG: hypothetical protein AB7K04_07440 [Pseudorhodoplanes sp.]
MPPDPLETLDSIRHRFNRRRKSRLSFDELRICFERNESYGEIARKSGISRARIRVLHDTLYRPIFGYAAGRQRRRQRALRNDIRNSERLKKLPSSRKMRAVARAEGPYRIRPAPNLQQKRPGEVRKREALIAGKLCGVHHLRNVRGKDGAARSTTTTIRRNAVAQHAMEYFYIDTPFERKLEKRTRRELLSFLGNREKATIYFRLGP